MASSISLLEIVDNSLGFGAKYNDGVKLPWNNSEDSEQEGSIMKENIVKLINEQINAELYSAYLYLAFADYYEE